MATLLLHIGIAATALALVCDTINAQGPLDLHAAARTGGIEVRNRKLNIIDEPGYAGVQLSTDYGEGLAWLKGIDFSNGVIEFDVRGVNVEGHSFVGIAFHGANDSTFDAIYLRPFHFRKADKEAHSHSIQYISLPRYTWRSLRATQPGVYEDAVDPSLDPNGWVHMRVVIDGDNITVYLNGAAEATLTVKKLTKHHNGLVGLYVADTSGGDFANLKITAAN